jgi:hypothetical protein
MSKPFQYSCTKDLRHYLRPLLTSDELAHLKQYFYYQKNLARHLIKYQRLLTSEYNHQGIRYNNRLFIDKKTFINLGFSPLRSNPNLFVINEKRFNQILNISHTESSPSKHVIDSPVSPILSIDNSIFDIKPIDTTISKLIKCSTLIAEGHGIANIMYPPINIDSSQLYTFQTRHGWKDEDISLSKTSKKILNRSLFRREINSKSSDIHLFTTTDKISQNEV